MNRNHLMAFHAVASTGSFSRGAERLMVSQPAVSLQVGELERALGVALFDRLPRGARLTPAGTILADYAARIATFEADAERALRQFKGLERGRLVLGASLTIGSYVLPPMLAEFRRRHPEIDIDLEIANSTEIQNRLLNGSLECGFTEGLVRDPRLAGTIFQNDQLVAIAPAGHRLLKSKRLTIAQLCAEPIIFREVGSGTRQIVEQALSASRQTPNITMSLGSTEAIKSAVVSGLGIAIVSSLAITAELTAGTLAVIRVADLRITRALHRLVVRGQTLSPAAAEFIAMTAQNS